MKQLSFIIIICFIFASFSNGQSITSVYPDNADRCGSLQVTISGQNTNFGQGTSTTTAWFQQGSSTIIIPDSVSIISSTLLNASFTFSQSYPTGYYDVYVNNSVDGTIIDYYGFELFDLSNTGINIYPDPACPNEKINFSAWGSSTYSYLWNFGDGSPTSNDSYTDHTYTTAGSYPVWVKITNTCGDDIFLFQTVNVENNLPVSNVYFNISPNPVCPNERVNFSAWGNSVYSYLWNFGDGSPTSNVSSYTDHAYTSAGSYPVWVKITNTCGNDTILYQTVYVENNLPVSNVNFNISPNPVCPNENVYFYVYGSSSYAYLWNFGDGSPTSNTSNTYHSYTSAGSYPVWVKITNGCGNDTILYQTVNVENNLPVSNVNFNISPNPVCPNEPVSFLAWGGGSYTYLWNFGDGSPVSNYSYSSHIYTTAGSYPTWLKITNGCGNDTILYQTVNVENNLPVSGLDFDISPNPVCPGDKVYFQGWGNASSFVWNFGDGSPTSNNSYTNHSYTSSGTYTVSLTLTNGCGNDTILYETVNVENNLPVTNADFDISPNPVCPNNGVSFQVWGNSSYSYLWNFGDGSPTSNNYYANHTYTSAGSYSVWVKITNGCGNDTVLYETVNVENNLPVTNADFDISPNPVCPNNGVSFQVWGNSSYSYLWNFGDGSPTSNNYYANHTYTSAGSYSVWVKITNGCGNDTILYETVNVENNLIPAPDNYDYGSISDEACPGDTVIFYIEPSGNSYLLDFGDGNSTTSFTQFNDDGYFLDIAKHVYSNIGNYTVTFTLTNGCGNSFTDSFNVNIGNNIPIDGWFWWYDEDPTIGENIEFFALGGSSYIWNFGDGSAVITTTSSLSPVIHSYASSGTYTITVTISNSCGNSESYTESITIGPEGIEENKLLSYLFFRLYPNPSHGIFSLETENTGKENLLIEIMNIYGQCTYRKQFNNVEKTIAEIDLSGHARGIYFVKVQSENNINIEKLIIK